jgi:hypothetical protein
MAIMRVCGCFCLLFAALCAAQSPREVTFDGLRDSNPGATFDHGYVGAWDLVHVHSATLYDPEGRKMFDVTSFKLPDGTKTAAPMSVAVDTDGVSAFVYWGQQGTRSGIAILDSVGNQLRVIQTEPYKPSQVCFAPDHSIWMFGDQWKARRDLPVSDFMTFRHYSSDGKLLGSFVPRSALPAWEGEGLDQLVGPFVGLWRLRATRDRIGAALRIAPYKHAWVELNLNGELIRQWIYTDSRNDSVIPSAFDSKGLLYGMHWIDEKRVGISVFDKSTSSWKPVSSLPSDFLIGADGTRLVYQKGDTLRWFEGLNTELKESAAVSQP